MVERLKYPVVSAVLLVYPKRHCVMTNPHQTEEIFYVGFGVFLGTKSQYRFLFITMILVPFVLLLMSLLYCGICMGLNIFVLEPFFCETFNSLVSLENISDCASFVLSSGYNEYKNNPPHVSSQEFSFNFILFGAL